MGGVFDVGVEAGYLGEGFFPAEETVPAEFSSCATDSVVENEADLDQEGATFGGGAWPVSDNSKRRTQDSREGGENGDDSLSRSDEVGRVDEKAVSLVQGFFDQPKLSVFEVANPP